jgi:hypothetical protein
MYRHTLQAARVAWRTSAASILGDPRRIRANKLSALSSGPARLLHPHPESVDPAADRHPQAVHGTGTDTSRLNPDSESAVGRKRDAT